MGHLLIVEDDAAIQRTLGRIVMRYCVAHFASNVEEALAHVAGRDDWCGFLIDLGLGDKSFAGFHVLEHVRQRFPNVPAMIVTGHIDVAVVNRVATLGSMVIGKPFGEAELAAFLRRVTSYEREFAMTFASRIEGLARQWKLSPREYEIVAWLVAGGTRASYLAHNGMALTTFRTHMKHILQKAGAATFSELLSIALRSIFAQEKRA